MDAFLYFVGLLYKKMGRLGATNYILILKFNFSCLLYYLRFNGQMRDTKVPFYPYIFYVFL